MTADLGEIELRLRVRVDVEIDTAAPLAEVVEAVIEAAGEPRR